MYSRLNTIDEEKEFESFIEAIYKSAENSIKTELSNIIVPPPYRLRIKVIYSQNNPLDQLENAVAKLKLERLNGLPGRYRYREIIGRKTRKDIQVSFVTIPFDHQSNVQAIIAICKSDQWTILRRFLKQSYPKLVPVLLSQSELIRCSRQIKKFTKHEVHVRSWSAKEKLEGKFYKHRKSVREWTEEEIDDVLLKIRHRQLFFTSIDIDFYTKIGERIHPRPIGSFKIRKDGEIAVTGNFSLAFNHVATEIAKTGEEKLAFLSGRGLREAKYKPKPVAVNFDQSIFKDKQDIRDLVSLLIKYPNSMHSVKHGNPYAHLKLTDIFDGSSFDIWAITENKVALIPGLKATEAAFERLIHYIFDSFREGEISEYE